MKRLGLYWHTTRHFLPRQLFYQVLNRIRRKPALIIPTTPVAGYPLSFPPPDKPQSWAEHAFTFLNQTVSFPSQVDWNYAVNGKLWTYNLTYFDFLNQPNLPPEVGLALIRQFMTQTAHLKDALEPYPTSLRIINWVRFLSYHRCQLPEVNAHLWSQLRLLAGRLEYHLMGNHLLENGFALLLGALYFRDRALYRQGVRVVTAELKTQVLADGGHDERSPMYHQILLDRLLDICQVIQRDDWHDDLAIDVFLVQHAQRMLGWLRPMSFGNGDVPLVNDAARSIAPTTQQLREKAQSIGVEPSLIKLFDSGYRRFGTLYYDFVTDVGPVGPDHQPGHAHADTFNFVLYAAGQPVIVDAGTSTYAIGARRQWERSTAAHNTVEVARTDSSEVWGGFRVARRARVTLLTDMPSHLVARHDGYQQLGITHERSWTLVDERTILIKDRLIGKEGCSGMARIYFHPDIAVSMDAGGILAGPLRIELSCISMEQVTIGDYQYAEGFNCLHPSQRLEIPFTSTLEMSLTVQE